MAMHGCLLSVMRESFRPNRFARAEQRSKIIMRCDNALGFEFS